MSRSLNYSSQIFGKLKHATRILGEQVLDEAAWKVIELTNQNFRNKSFFGDPWKPNAVGSPTLVKSGRLRVSVRVDRRKGRVRFYSDLEYAYIHNYGGRLKPSSQLEKFLWAQYAKTKLDVYKYSALKVRAGDQIEIPKRQYIGEHPIQTAAIGRIIDRKLMTLGR